MDDLPIFYEQQLDPDANHMAAFTVENPSDWDAFEIRWARILREASIVKKTIVCEGAVAGSIASFEQDGEREICYWLGRSYWGRGVATSALTAFLPLITTRPLHARAAKDNAASIRVLEKCGFAISSEDVGFANARGKEIEEYIFVIP
ncbi:MAG: hypothetical protein JWQ02_756 [Capsulimonas sp.]|jgi:RimJ/RimL family protein N-acetyltransferase|nr:hypothetical protein [Capsulimonas sp.]